MHVTDAWVVVIEGRGVALRSCEFEVWWGEEKSGEEEAAKDAKDLTHCLWDYLRYIFYTGLMLIIKIVIKIQKIE